MRQIEWKELARRHGWDEAIIENEPCLVHRDLDRCWPLPDYEGACRDIGLCGGHQTRQ